MAENKKPFYKKWWFWLIVIIIIIILATSGGDDEEDKNQTENQTTNVENEPDTNKKDKLKEKEGKASEGRIKSGTYKVGTDIPSGEYLVFADDMGYIESAKDSTGNLESIIFNDNLDDSHSYVTLHDGEYFKLQGAYMYPIDKAPSVIPKDGEYEDGMYRVGIDIPAGEYKVILDDDTGMGYYEVSKDSTHQLDSIITNENVQADTYLTVSDGQYLKLQGVEIRTK